MMKLNFIEKSLDGVEFEWKKLSEIALVGTGSRNTNEATLDGQYPFFVRSQKPRLIDEYEFDETAIVTAGDGVGVGKVFHYVTGKYALHQRAYRIVVTSGNVLPKFLFHFVRYDFARYLVNISVHASVTSLRMPMFEKYPVPIPPLEVQAEIVRILDTFTEITEKLTAELTAELTARKKQYTYYLDKLLTFDEGEVEWKPIIEVGELVRGNGMPKTDFTDVGVPAIHYGQIYTYYGAYTTETISFVSPETAKKLRKVDHGDVVITNTSENLEDVGKAVVYLGEVKAVTGGHATIFKPSHKILGKYFAYFTQTEMFAKQKRKYAKGTKVIDVSATDMAKIEIPIPYPNDLTKSLEEQNRIISILDKFDSLISSITEGLPREIELRQKQYEYYRNMLLSFPKEEVEE